MTQLEKLRAVALSLYSTVHNEQQLSTIELCAMVSKKTNEIIDVVNELTKYIETLEVGINLKYDELTESLDLA